MERKVFDVGGHAHLLTFSWYRRRRLLDDNRAKGTVIHFLADQLRRGGGACMGFVIMPDHVHALIHFKQPGMLGQFMQQWKTQSSIRLKEWIKKHLPAYAMAIELALPIWQPRYYDFNVFSSKM
jgi:putative transposase